MKKPDEVTDSLTKLSGELPQAATHLSETEKDAIVQKIGPLTVRNIVNSKKTSAASRIPFLFSSIDTQAVVNILAHDFTAAIERGLQQKKK